MKCLICEKIIIYKMDYSSLLPKRLSLICNDCRYNLEKVSGGCVRCGKKIEAKICSDCLLWEKKMPEIVRNYSLYYYNNFARELVRKIKFLGDLAPLYVFQNDIKAFFKNFKKKNYLLVPIPLHKDRLYERGFNQSILLAKLINMPVFDILLKNNNDRQSKKKRTQRLILDNQYSLKSNDIDLRKKNIIIIDDIYTTGATIHKVAKLLFTKNVSNIISFTLFRS